MSNNKAKLTEDQSRVIHYELRSRTALRKAINSLISENIPEIEIIRSLKHLMVKLRESGRIDGW